MAENDAGRNFPEPPEGLVKPQDDSVVAFLDDPDQLEAAVTELVGAHGAHGMAHFGRDHWEPLGS